MRRDHLDADIGVLPPSVSVPRGHPAAAHGARGAEAFAATSARAVTTIPVPRIHYLARCIHLLGERPLAELFIDLAAGEDLHGSLERYARLAPVADLIREFGGDRLTTPRAVSGGRR
jgi:hypothetical protein